MASPEQPHPSPTPQGQPGSSRLGEPAPGEPGAAGNPLPGHAPAPGGTPTPAPEPGGVPGGAPGAEHTPSPAGSEHGYTMPTHTVTGPPSPPHNSDKKNSKEPPQDIKDARMAWMWTALLQAVLGILTAIEFIVDPSMMDSAIEQAKETYGMSAEDVSNSAIASASGIVIALFYVAVSALAVVLIKELVKGKKWPRFILIVGSAYLIINGVSSVFAVPDNGSDTFVWATGSLAIISAVLAAVGVWFSTRVPATDYLNGKDPSDDSDDTTRTSRK